MAGETLYKGDIRMLYIKEDATWYPVACLIGSPFKEDVEMLNTTTRENEGWETFLPTKQSYSINFNGLQLLTISGGDTTKMSYDRLKFIKRNRTLVEWKIEDTGGLFDETGYGYIQRLGEDNQVGEFLEFDGIIVGYGEY